MLYRATHRGTYETDLIIGSFTQRHIAGMDQPALDALEAVMDYPDIDLADWLTGRRPIPDFADSQMLRRIRCEAPEVVLSKPER
jgi:antitoxin CptB